jgi:hypothetical protein
MYAKIHRPSRNPMQSGQRKTNEWVVEFEPETPFRSKDPLMGWTRSADTNSQVRLEFDTREAAIEYCVRHKIPHRVIEPREPIRRPKSYAANFNTSRKQPWTH